MSRKIGLPISRQVFLHYTLLHPPRDWTIGFSIYVVLRWVMIFLWTLDMFLDFIGGHVIMKLLCFGPGPFRFYLGSSTIRFPRFTIFNFNEYIKLISILLALGLFLINLTLWDNLNYVKLYCWCQYIYQNCLMQTFIRKMGISGIFSTNYSINW